MAQHDMIIDNAVGATVRADINAALLALVGNNSGATAPATTYAYMLWYDTANTILKQRNSANTAWGGVDVAPATTATQAVRLDQINLQPKTGSFNRVTNAASGNVAVTGLGFKPSSIFILAAIDSVTGYSDGFSSLAGGRSIWSDGTGVITSGAYLVNYTRTNAGVNTQTAVVASLDADGFTLTWTYSGAGTNTNNIICNYIAYR